MGRRLGFGFGCAWAFVLAGTGGFAAQDDAAAELPPAVARDVDYARDVAPLLERSCFRCHGPKKHQGGLALHEEAKAMAGGDGGPVIVPGKGAESRLIVAAAQVDPDLVMPPEGSGDPLTAEEVGVLRAWIDRGAKWPAAAGSAAKTASDHWSFNPPRTPTPPDVRLAAWPRNPIDRFVLARLEKEGLAPSPEADRRTLIRRLSLDLIGLPPAPEEVDAFLADDRHDAYERLVDRLLASPRYGEQWGRHWLDRARYADTNGYEKDRERSIWPFRDWVVDALNADMPFDRFTVEQLAGDLLPDPTPDQLTATGFHRNTMINEEGGIDVEEYRFAAVVDRVATTGATWLGLTIQCAQCHTHKYDPITQREYYQLFAFLDNADEPDYSLPDPDVAARREAIEAKAREMEAALPSRYPAEGPDSLKAKMETWEKAIRPVRWAVVPPAKVVSRKGATMTVLPDGSVLASGDKPNNDVYEVDLPTDLKATAIRLEVLPDPSLPSNGPGRAPLFSVGDFMLTEVEATASPRASADAPRPLKFARATEDFAGKGKSAAKAIDGVTDTGWGVAGGVGKPHSAVFELAEPLDGRPAVIHLTLHQEFIHQTTIGRFRLSVAADPTPVSASGVPAEVEEILLVEPAGRSPEQLRALEAHYLAVAPELADARKPIDALRASAPKFAETMIMRERAPEHARTTRIHKRGEFLKPADPVQPGVPAVLHPLPSDAPANRLTFARWLVAPENPLVGRVIANQLWQAYFGRGLVTTPEDFGTQGEKPTHPDLLDWLATELPRRGWSLKAMHRAIVTSATYRQDSRATPEQIARDPKNELLARGPRFRVGAETIRDVALAAAGLLDARIGGPSVHPPQPEGANSLAYGQAAWRADVGADRYRRGLYTYLKRTAPYASFATMDAPTPEVACVRRERSNTPLQALAMLNDLVFVEAAQALARRVVRERPGATPGERLDLAYRLVLGRLPRDDERARVLAFHAGQLSRFRDGSLDAGQVAGSKVPTPPSPLLSTPDGVDLPDLAAWTAVSRVLLNLDEAVTKE